MDEKHRVTTATPVYYATAPSLNSCYVDYDGDSGGATNNMDMRHDHVQEVEDG
jgi:hypothetical protein